MAKKKKTAKPRAKADSSPSPAAEEQPAVFPIVGVGASAGGLEALRALLEAMPDEPGLALVVIQHLDPTKKSLAPELLAKYTSMQVTQVDDDPHVKPNRVYVIPPGKYLGISGGELHLSEPDRPRGARMAIDFFLRSLAKDQRQRAVAVILSGTGADGTLGIKAVKAEGGFVVAQDPASAEHDGMPRSAIETGIVDRVLPPDKIPEVLLRYADHPYVRDERPSEPEDESPPPLAEPEELNGLTAILSLLRTRTRHDFRNYKEKTLIRRTRRRMCLHHLKDYGEYLEHLRSDEGEAERLVKDLLISVTDFFRDPEAWNELEELAIRPLVERKPAGEPIRVWLPGCATGEEAYSLAMLLAENCRKAKKTSPLQLFASDIDKDALDYARAGLYPTTIAGDISPERLARFFEHVDGNHHYRVSKSLRELVVFADQNLIGDPPFSRLDLICCRNLLIYLKADIQEKIISLFHFALCDGGFLMLGSAETIGRGHDLFETVNKRWRIYRRTGSTRANRVEIPISPDVPRHEITPAHSPAERRERRLVQLAQQRLLDLIGPSAVLVDSNWRILYICGEIDEFLTHKPGLPTDNLLDKARHGLRSRLRGAIHKALQENRAVTTEARMQRGGRQHPVRLTVHPITERELDQKLALVMFESERGEAPAEPRSGDTGTRTAQQELRPPAEPRGGDSGTRAAQQELRPPAEPRGGDTGTRTAREGEAPAEPRGGDSGTRAAQQELRPPAEPAGGDSWPGGAGELDDNSVIQQLEGELAVVRADLQATVEQLESSNEEYKAANEEVMSINEELQSTNEELETSKEELQSLNEELSTVNSQLAGKVEELEAKHNDLANLISSTDIATICLDTSLAVRWFTPASAKLIRLTEADKGRPLSDFAHDFIDGDLVQIARRVLDRLETIEHEVEAHDERFFLRRVSPYRTDDHRIGGVVISLIDITSRRRAENALRDAKNLSDNIIDTVREPMLVLDPRLKVLSANDSFYRAFQVTPRATEGRLIYELGDHEWDNPRLRELLEEILPNDGGLNDFEVEQDFDRIGRRTMLLNARRIAEAELILLAIADVTEEKKARAALEVSEERLRRAAEGAQIGIWEWHFDSDEVFWNEIEQALIGAEPISESANVQAFFDRVHPDDKAMLRRKVDLAREGAAYDHEFRVICRDGQTRWLAGKGEIIRDERGEPLKMMGVNYDVTSRKEQEQKIRQLNEALEKQVAQRTEMLNILQDVTRAANEARTVEEALRGAMERISDYNGWQVGHVWRLAEDAKGDMVSTGIWLLREDATPAVGRLARLQRISAETRIAPGKGLIGRVVQACEPQWIDDIDDFDDWQRNGARELELRAAIAFPITVDGKVVAVMEFFSDHPARREERFMEIMPDVGIQLGHVIEREMLKASIAEATSEQQRHFGQELHDSVSQEMTGIGMLAQSLRQRLADSGSPHAEDAAALIEHLKGAHEQVRRLSRGLMPVEVDAAGLMAALEELIESSEEMYGLDCLFHCREEVELENNTIATHLYRIAQEAIQNAVKHGRPTRIEVSLETGDGHVILTIADNGAGFQKDASDSHGAGRRIMQYRADLIGAELSIASEPGEGVIVTCRLPREKLRSTM